MTRPLFISPDGYRRLTEYADGVLGREFVWGASDCWIVVRDGVRALSGCVEFGADVLPYSDEGTAVMAFQVMGGEEYLGRWGLRRVASLHERARGDVLVFNDGERSLGFRLVVDHRVLCMEEGRVAHWGVIVNDDAPVHVWRLG